MAQLDRRFLMLPELRRPGIIRAVVQDSAALLGAHLYYRCGVQVISSAPAGPAPSFGQSPGMVRRQVCLEPHVSPSLPDAEALLERLTGWSSGRLVVWLRGRGSRRQCRQFRLLDWTDCTELDWWRSQIPTVAQEFLAWRLLPGGQMEQLHSLR